MYLLDVITSPVAWAAFGAGCMFTAVCALAAAWWAGRWARIQRARADSVHARPPDDEWEGGMIADRWVNVTHRTSISPFYVHVVNETTQNTETGYLTHDQARSLATWILDHLRGVPK